MLAEVFAASDAVVVAAAIAAIGSIFTAGMSLVAGHRSKRATKVVQQVHEQVQPANGRQLAAIVEDLERTVEVVGGRVHEISKRVDAHDRELAGIRVDTKATAGQVIALSEYVEELTIAAGIERRTQTVRRTAARKEDG